MTCSGRAQLETARNRAERAFDSAHAELRKRIGTSSKEEYEQLNCAVDEAWSGLQLVRARLAGAVICRQQPSTAKGFVFLSLEDETGIANVIFKPDVFRRLRVTILNNGYLVVDGILQNRRAWTR